MKNKVKVKGKLYDIDMDTGIVDVFKSGSALALVKSQALHMKVHEELLREAAKARETKLKYTADKLDELTKNIGESLKTSELTFIYMSVFTEIEAKCRYDIDFDPEKDVKKTYNSYMVKEYDIVKATRLAKKMYPELKESNNGMLYIKKQN